MCRCVPAWVPASARAWRHGPPAPFLLEGLGRLRQDPPGSVREARLGGRGRGEGGRQLIFPGFREQGQCGRIRAPVSLAAAHSSLRSASVVIKFQIHRQKREPRNALRPARRARGASPASALGSYVPLFPAHGQARVCLISFPLRLDGPVKAGAGKEGIGVASVLQEGGPRWTSRKEAPTTTELGAPWAPSSVSFWLLVHSLISYYLLGSWVDLGEPRGWGGR